MEGGQKKSGSPSSSSTFTSQLFGFATESQKSSSSSTSAGIFASMFSPPATVAANGFQHQQRDWVSNKGSPGMSQQEKGQPCHLSSSLYYGGQDMYSSTPDSAALSSSVKKNKEEDDPNGNNSQGASRGNWWQGSLYY